MQEIAQWFQNYHNYLLAGYLGICSVTDLAAKRISLTWTGFCFVIGLIGQLAGLFALSVQTDRAGFFVCDSVMALLYCLLPGIFLLVVSLMTGNQLGCADAFVFLTCGIFLGLYQTILLLMLSLFMTGIWGILLILLHKGSRQKALPWMPFIFAGFLVLELTGMSGR